MGKMFINGKIASTQLQLMHFVSISIDTVVVSKLPTALPPMLNSSRWLFVGSIFKPVTLLPFSTEKTSLIQLANNALKSKPIPFDLIVFVHCSGMFIRKLLRESTNGQLSS